MLVCGRYSEDASVAGVEWATGWFGGGGGSRKQDQKESRGAIVEVLIGPCKDSGWRTEPQFWVFVPSTGIKVEQYIYDSTKKRSFVPASEEKNYPWGFYINARKANNQEGHL